MTSNPFERSLNRMSDYSDEAIFSELRRVSEHLGKQVLSIKDVDEHCRCSYAVIKKRFGGLRSALQKAGLNVETYKRGATKDELLRNLAEVWEKTITQYGRRPYVSDLIKLDSAWSSNAYRRHFGSWIRACEALLEWDEQEFQKQPRQGNKRTLANEHVERPSPVRAKRTIPLRIRYAILVRDRFTCAICGASPSTQPGTVLHVDHIVPESQGGTLDERNLRCLCSDCNIGKGALPENFESGG